MVQDQTRNKRSGKWKAVERLFPSSELRVKWGKQRKLVKTLKPSKILLEISPAPVTAQQGKKRCPEHSPEKWPKKPVRSVLGTSRNLHHRYLIKIRQIVLIPLPSRHCWKFLHMCIQQRPLRLSSTGMATWCHSSWSGVWWGTNFRKITPISHCQVTLTMLR